MENTGSSTHYNRPDWFTRNVFNRAVAGLTRAGVSVWGSRVLEVKGRKSGQPRRTPVNLLHFGDSDYLVAARGQTEWVRNVRAADGRFDLLKGRRRQSVRGVELADADKPAVLRAYLKRWKMEVGMFFEGVGPDSSDEEVAAIAAKHPVFKILPA